MSFLKKLKSKENKEKKKISLIFSLLFLLIVFLLWFFTKDYSFETNKVNSLQEIKSDFSDIKKSFDNFEFSF